MTRGRSRSQRSKELKGLASAINYDGSALRGRMEERWEKSGRRAKSLNLISVTYEVINNDMEC